MWKTKLFKTRAQLVAFVKRNGHRIQWSEIFVNNAYGIEYRMLRRML